MVIETYESGGTYPSTPVYHVDNPSEAPENVARTGMGHRSKMILDAC